MKILKFTALCGALGILSGVAFAGAVSGPTRLDETVQQGKIDVYRIQFKGGEKATVRAKPRGGNVELCVYDANDVLVQKSADGAVLVCTWTPKDTGEFKVKIVNNDSREVGYKLETN